MHIYKQMVKPAYLASDVKTLNEAYEKWIALGWQMKDIDKEIRTKKRVIPYESQIGGWYQEWARHTALLTGDRDRAAALWIKGYEIWREAEKGSGMMRPQGYKPPPKWQDANLPKWFPDNMKKDKKKDKGKDKKGKKPKPAD